MAEARPMRVLLCRQRACLCALPIEHLVEIMRPLPVTPFPDAPPFVSGLSIIRGVPVPVIDLGALLGGPEPRPAGRLVTLRLGERRVALAVEAVLGIRELPVTAGGIPPLLEEAVADTVAAVGALDAELLLVLRSARLVPDSLWQPLERGNS